MKKLILVLCFLPTLVSAGLVEKIPIGNHWLGKFDINGTIIWQVILGTLTTAHAGEMTIGQQFESYTKTMADFFGSDRKELLETSNCESGWVKYPEEAMTILGDNGNSFGPWQYHINPKTGFDTFDYFKKKAGMPELERKNWRDSTKLTAWVFSDLNPDRLKDKKRWTCYRDIFITGKRPMSTNW